MTRHGSLAEQLAAFRQYATMPDHELEPIQTNWSTVPENDNNPEDVVEMQVERRWRMKPSTEEIMRQVKTGDVERGDPSEMEITKNDQSKVVVVPGPIIRIGRLRFSDGAQTEQAMKVTIDGKVVTFQARMPTGALLGTKDAAESQLGAEEDGQHVAASNAYFVEMFGTLPHRYKAGSKRRKGKNYSHEESKALLVSALANTDMTKVTRTYYPSGLPCGSAKVSENFLGMQKSTKGESGSLMWQDIVSARADQGAWLWAVASLAEKDRSVLDVAAKAGTYEEVGVAAGQSRKYAKFNGGGRRALIAANDNLMAAIKKYSA